jgi:LysM repeat protein/lysophospholipase L1-like esterase
MRIFLSFLFFCFWTLGFSQQAASTIPNALQVKKNFNFLQFDDQALMKQLVSGLQSAKSSGYSIVHFGDSHIQAETPTAVVRKNLQAEYGDGGKGMMFAYSAANSYSSILYSTSHTGNWTYAKSFQSAPKLPLGVTGMTVRTDEKNVKLIFTLKKPSPSYQNLKVFIKKDTSSFDFNLITNEATIRIKLADCLSSSLPYIEIPIIGNQTSFTIETVQNRATQNHFEFYGMSLETPSKKGILYHSVGVGASQYGSLLLEELLDDQLPALSPNLIVLDFGTNNYLYDNQVKPELGVQIEKIISDLRVMCPKALILLTSTQDLYYKSKHVTEGITFRNLVDSLAKKNKCLFWDWYAVAGGKKSLTKWRDAGYAQSDLVHLTSKGYELKGQLLFEAIKNSMDSIQKNPAVSQLLLSYTESKDIVQTTAEVPKKIETAPVKPKKEEVKPKVPEVKTTVTPKKPEVKKPVAKVKSHTVKKGDTLYGLAAKYKVSVAQLKKANRLKSDNLQIGQKLIIP